MPSEFVLKFEYITVIAGCDRGFILTQDQWNYFLPYVEFYEILFDLFLFLIEG